MAQTLRATSPSNRIKKRKLSKVHIEKEKSLRKENASSSDVSYVPIVMPSDVKASKVSSNNFNITR